MRGSTKHCAGIQERPHAYRPGKSGKTDSFRPVSCPVRWAGSREVTANSRRGIEERRTGGHNPALAEKRIWQQIRRSAYRDKRTELGELECERLGADGKVTAHGRDSLLRLDKPNATEFPQIEGIRFGCGALEVATLRLCHLQRMPEPAGKTSFPRRIAQDPTPVVSSPARHHGGFT